jgi:hypothetical protein
MASELIGRALCVIEANGAAIVNMRQYSAAEQRGTDKQRHEEGATSSTHGE